MSIHDKMWGKFVDPFFLNELPELHNPRKLEEEASE